MTIDEVFSSAAAKGLVAKRWCGSRLISYNGYIHEERVRKWQALDLAIRMGLEQPAALASCAVCGAQPSPVIAYHSEDFGSMSGHYPVCRSCHTRIHNRFRNPERWNEFLATVGVGSKWFEQLSCNDRSRETSHVEEPASARKHDHKELKMSLPPGPSRAASSPDNPRKEMNAARVAFVKALGIEHQRMNPNPDSGYKFEHNLVKREGYLAEARRLREVYAEMVTKHGINQNVLDKMDSNLANRDRMVHWR